MKQFGVHV
jgi:alpha-glucosidase (family GH31 glycosyl hydrolase)